MGLQIPPFSQSVSFSIYRPDFSNKTHGLQNSRLSFPSFITIAGLRILPALKFWNVRSGAFIIINRINLMEMGVLEEEWEKITTIQI